MLVISDTSPVSNLLIIGQLHLLPALYQQVVIPVGVADELRRMRSHQAAIDECLASDWLTIRAIQNINLFHNLRAELDSGEAEAITLAVEL